MVQAVMGLIAFWVTLLPWFAGDVVDVQRDLVYNESYPKACTLNLYLPKGEPGPHPCVVVVHGGAWVVGGNGDWVDFDRRLAVDGFAAAAINFRLRPSGGFLDQVRDVKDSIRWLRANAAQYNIDPHRIALFGSSSGAHLAGLAGLAGDGDGFGDDPPGLSSEVQALFLLFGIYDLRELPPNALIRWYVGASIGDEPAAHAFFSPIVHADKGDPPTRVMHGAADAYVPPSQPIALMEALNAAGVDAAYVGVEGQGHGFAKLHPWTRPMVYDHLIAFLRTHLTAP